MTPGEPDELPASPPLIPPALLLPSGSTSPPLDDEAGGMTAQKDGERPAYSNQNAQTQLARSSNTVEITRSASGSPSAPLTPTASAVLPPEKPSPLTETAPCCKSPSPDPVERPPMTAPPSKSSPNKNSPETAAHCVGDGQSMLLPNCVSACAVETTSKTHTVSEDDAVQAGEVRKMNQDDVGAAGIGVDNGQPMSLPSCVNACAVESKSKTVTTGDGTLVTSDVGIERTVMPDPKSLNFCPSLSEIGRVGILPVTMSENGAVQPGKESKVRQDDAASSSLDVQVPTTDASDDSGCSSSSSDSEDESAHDALFDKAQKETREKLAKGKEAEELNATSSVPILSKNEVAAENLEVEPITVTISGSDTLHPAGTIQAIMKAKKAVTVNTVAPDARPRPVYSIEEIWKASALNTDSLLCFENRAPLGRVADTLGPVDGPLYLVRFNSEEDMDALSQLTVGAPVFYVEKHSNVVYGKQIHQKGYDTSNMHDEESNAVEYSDDEEERAARKRRAALRISDGEGKDRRPVKHPRSERPGRGRRGAISPGGVSRNPYDQRSFANDGRTYRGTQGSRRGRYTAPNVAPQYGGMMPMMNQNHAPGMNFHAPPSLTHSAGRQNFYVPPSQMPYVGQQHLAGMQHGQMFNANGYAMSQMHSTGPENFPGVQHGQYNQIFSAHGYPMPQSIPQPMRPLPHSLPSALHPPVLGQTTYGGANGHFQETPQQVGTRPPQFPGPVYPPPPPPEFYGGRRE